MEIKQFHFDAFAKINTMNAAFTHKENFFIKEIGARLLLPVLTALIGVAHIFKQITRVIADLLNLQFKAAARDLGGVVVQTVALPILILGNFVAPTQTKQLLRNHVMDKLNVPYNPIAYYKDGSYNRVSNIVISIIQVPAQIVKAAVNFVCTMLKPSIGAPRWNAFIRATITPITAPLDSLHNAVMGLFNQEIRVNSTKILA